MENSNQEFLSLDEEKYRLGEFLGKGTYGLVIKAFDKRHHRDVAIKRMSNIDESALGTSKIVRELFLLYSLRHSNVLSMIDLKMGDDSDRSIFLVTEYCDFDLHQIAYADRKGSTSRKSIIKKRCDYIKVFCQILEAVKYIHSIGVLHRDIKPANILVSSNLHVKLCDFGFARLVNNCEEYLADGEESLTEYVVTRWYRAPEVFLNPGRYGKPQDVWAVACSFCEVFRRYPLFPGENTVDQVRIVVDAMGSITPDDFNFEMTPRGRRFLNRLSCTGRGLKPEIGGARDIHPNLMNLLLDMLQFNPHRRISAADALQWSMFDIYRHDEEEEIQEICWDDYHSYLSNIKPNMQKFELFEALQTLSNDLVNDIRKHEIDSHFNAIIGEMEDDDNASVASNATNMTFADAMPKGLNNDGSLCLAHTENMTTALNTFAEKNNKRFNIRELFGSAVIVPDSRGSSLKKKSYNFGSGSLMTKLTKTTAASSEAANTRHGKAELGGEKHQRTLPERFLAMTGFMFRRHSTVTSPDSNNDADVHDRQDSHENNARNTGGPREAEVCISVTRIPPEKDSEINSSPEKQLVRGTVWKTAGAVITTVRASASVLMSPTGAAGSSSLSLHKSVSKYETSSLSHELSKRGIHQLNETIKRKDVVNALEHSEKKR